MKKISLFKRVFGVVFCALVIITALPFFPVKTKAATLSQAPERDWTGYTAIYSVEQLREEINNDPYGKFYLICDIEIRSKDVQSGGKFYSSEYGGWRPLCTGYYEICEDAKVLKGFNWALRKYKVLYTYNAADDTYSEIYEYDPSITEYYYYDAFFGVIDGNGYFIDGIEMYSYNEINGFIGVNYGTIHDLGVYGEIAGYAYNGAVCGINYGVISDCISGGRIYGGGILGGICGVNYGNVIGCKNNAWVTGDIYCGGIAGMNSGYIQNSFTFGEISATDYSGGIAGIAYHSTITECVTYASITSENGTQGLVVGQEADDGYACNKYRNFVYRSYLTVHRGEKGTADIIRPADTFTSGGGYYFTKPYFYTDKGFDTKHDIYFASEDSLPNAITCATKSYIACSAIWDGSAVNRMTKGTGTKKNPYVIETAAELAYLSNRVAAGDSLEGKYIELGCDIDLNDVSIKYWFANAAEFRPIGNAENPFSGHFDGKGYTIKGVCCDNADSTGAGLFGCVSNGSVKNVNAVVYIKATAFAGGICGINSDSVISNCNVEGYVRGIIYAGMICGSNYGEIDYCASSGTAYGTAWIGGISGDNIGKIAHSTSSARVIGAENYQGGISGDNYGEISDCYTVGDVLGIRYVGGITGENNDGRIENCYATGKISGWFNSASICGNNVVSGEINTAGVYNCYYLEGTATHFCGVVQKGLGSGVIAYSNPDKSGATKGYSSNDLKKAESFTGFDFNGVWYMDSAGGYPKLLPYTSVILGDVNGDGTVNSIDSNILKRYLADGSVEADIDASDLNSDGEVNAMDANLLRRMIAGNG